MHASRKWARRRRGAPTFSISWYRLIHTLGVEAEGLMRELARWYSRTICVVQAKGGSVRNCVEFRGLVHLESTKRKEWSQKLVPGHSLAATSSPRPHLAPHTCCRSPSATRLCMRLGMPNRLLKRRRRLLTCRGGRGAGRKGAGMSFAGDWGRGGQGGRGAGMRHTGRRLRVRVCLGGRCVSQV